MFRDKAIRNTHPTVVTIRGNGSTAADTNGDVVVLDESLISTEMARLQTEYDSQAYARSRASEYPTIQECVHAILDDDLDALQVLRQAVKDKYPKE
jgi:hypothetical protein